MTKKGFLLIFVILLFTDYPLEMPKLPPMPMLSTESKNVILDESEDTLKSAGVETSVELDNSTDVEMTE